MGAKQSSNNNNSRDQPSSSGSPMASTSGSSGLGLLNLRQRDGGSSSSSSSDSRQRARSLSNVLNGHSGQPISISPHHGGFEISGSPESDRNVPVEIPISRVYAAHSLPVQLVSFHGTVISPILFNIFINDLPDLLASDGLTNTALFADDLAIWCSTPKRDQSKLNIILNLTLERLHLWCIENNMTVNLKKTTCQFFTLNRQPFSPQLVYNGMPVQQSDVSIYLGCALDNKLKWTKHAEFVVSKARKRLSILKKLTGVKCGCNRDTLSITYKTYIQPVLNYCNEVLRSLPQRTLENFLTLSITKPFA
ncbi:putative RNA-directed DNA polymerase from transposon X-element [Trichonephila clavipes]|nr:putative RNA-directed DNA polymerase from transposon X-element [Trichonephila clavipes]